MPDNSSGPFFASTTATVGIPSSVTMGIARGLTRGGATLGTFSEGNTFRRNALLHSIELLQKFNTEFPERDFPGLGTFPEEVRDILFETAKIFATGAANLSRLPTLTASNVSQLPSDVSDAIHGLLSSIKDYKDYSKTQESSKLNLNQHEDVNYFANCHGLLSNLGKISDELSKVINKEIPENENVFNQTHSSMAKLTAIASMPLPLGSSLLVSSAFDAVGSLFREIQGIWTLQRQESSHSEHQDNIYKAFSHCCSVLTTGSDCKASLAALKEFERVLTKCELANKMSDVESVIAPKATVAIRYLTSGSFLMALRGFNSSAIAMTVANEALIQEKAHFSQATEKSPGKASSLDDAVKNHSQNVTDVRKVFDQAIGHIDELLGFMQEDVDKKSIASSAASSAWRTGTVVIASSLVTGLSGMLSRELSGTIDFLKHDKGTAAESRAVLDGRKDMLGADLDQLMTRACQLKERLERCAQLGVSAPVVLGVSHASTCGSLIAELNCIAGMCFALKEIKTFFDKPVPAFQLLEKEVKRVDAWEEGGVKASNQKSAGTMGTASASQQLSLEEHLGSVMKKVVLLSRGKENFFKPKMDERGDLNSSGKSSIAFAEMNSSGFLTGAIGTLSLVALESGIGTEALFNVSRYSIPDSARSSEGVDRTKLGAQSNFNLSSVSNATRISAEQSKGASFSNTVSKTTVNVAELLSSRSLTVFLCQSGVFTEIMKRIIAEREKEAREIPGFSKSSVLSDVIMEELPQVIEAMLDRDEQGHQPIPGLNHDMASELGSLSKSSISSILSTHSTLLASFLKSTTVLRNIVIEEKERKEALSGTLLSKTISEGLNVIQAFTRHAMDGFKAIADAEVKMSSDLDSSSLKGSVKANDYSAVASTCLTLLCDEFLESVISRSLTILDKEALSRSTQRSLHELPVQSTAATDGMKQDSGLPESHPLHMLSALRLTISHVGASLVDLAKALKAQADEGVSDLLQKDLAMHTSQKRLLSSMSQVISNTSIVLMEISGVLSRLPLVSVGTVDETRQVVHSTDAALDSKNIQTSAHCLKDSDSESTIVTALSTDTVVNVICAAVKLLLKASILGLDSSLAIAKTLEILLVHPRPFDASALETQASLQPNGISKESTVVEVKPLVGTDIVLAATSAEASTACLASSQSLVAIQHGVDTYIDAIQMLDDDEDPEASIRLKQFYELLIKVLEPMANQDDSKAGVEDLVERLNRGGLALASYHSTHGGVPGNCQPKGNSLIKDNHFQGCDDAAQLLNMFIVKAAKNTTLLSQLKEELLSGGAQASHKVKARWEYVVNQVYDKKMLTDMRHSFNAPSKSLQLQFQQEKQTLLGIWSENRAQAAEAPAVMVG